MDLAFGSGVVPVSTIAEGEGLAFGSRVAPVCTTAEGVEVALASRVIVFAVVLSIVSVIAPLVRPRPLVFYESHVLVVLKPDGHVQRAPPKERRYEGVHNVDTN